MAGLVRVGIFITLLLAVLFQVFLKDAIWFGLGIGRVPQPLTDFPYKCRKIVDPRMQACEDMWLSESTRQLFLACSDSVARSHWMPNVAKLNVSARSQEDAIVALNIDNPVGEGFEAHTLKTPGYTGTANDGLLQLVGFTGIDNPETGLVELLIINNRPSLNSNGELADQTVTGANQTVDLFETGPDAKEMKYVRSYVHENIATPNRVAAVDSKTFYLTNDHGAHKTGLRHHLSPFTSSGDAVICTNSDCHQVAKGFAFPNGLARDKSGLVYIPDSLTGTVTIYQPNNNTLSKIDEVKLGYSIDNVSIDKNGDVFVAAFPIGFAIFDAYKDPWGAHPPSAALRIKKTEEGYVVDKVIEDGEGSVLPASTTVVHDAKTGRLFFSSVISPWIAVCEPAE